MRATLMPFVWHSKYCLKFNTNPLFFCWNTSKPKKWFSLFFDRKVTIKLFSCFEQKIRKIYFKNDFLTQGKQLSLWKTLLSMPSKKLTQRIKTNMSRPESQLSDYFKKILLINIRISSQYLLFYIQYFLWR